MKNLIILLMLNIMLACQSQNINTMEPTVDNKFETFDNKKYQELVGLNENFPSQFDKEGNYLEMVKTNSNSAIYLTYSYSFFMIYKEFYKSGMIKTKGLKFNVWGGFKKGIWYYFNEEGKLVKETNYDEPYQFTFEDILKFCEKENIRVDKGPILQSTGFHTTIRRDVENGQPWWEIKRLKTPDTIEIIKLDGITGKVLSRTEQGYINN
ncbi:hypothetical protein [Empedobacter tilapiae]